MATHINIMVDLKACVLNTATSYAYGQEYITCILDMVNLTLALLALIASHRHTLTHCHTKYHQYCTYVPKYLQIWTFQQATLHVS